MWGEAAAGEVRSSAFTRVERQVIEGKAQQAQQEDERHIAARGEPHTRQQRKDCQCERGGEETEHGQVCGRIALQACPDAGECGTPEEHGNDGSQGKGCSGATFHGRHCKRRPVVAQKLAQG